MTPSRTTVAGGGNWLIIGAGVSGLGAAKLLRQRGCNVRVSERVQLNPEQAQKFLALGVELRDGGHATEHLADIDDIVVSPGLPPSHPLLSEAVRRGMRWQSEIDLALGVWRQTMRGRLLGVTGTNGKSTTCAMLGHMLERYGVPVSVGGNFGDPPSAMLAEGRMSEYLVLELSSYQLEQSRPVAADAAMFTSFSYDHLARHGSLAGYLAAKWRIFAEQPQGSVAVLPTYIERDAQAAGLHTKVRTLRVYANAEDLRQGKRTHGEDTEGFIVEGSGLRLVSGNHITLAPLGIKEPQNLLNAGYSLAALAHILGRPMVELAPLLAGFKGLAHRCERIGSLRRARQEEAPAPAAASATGTYSSTVPAALPVINDSKSTNVESTLVALASQDQPVILLMGGQGKGEPYGPILQEQRKIAALVTFGATGGQIASQLRGSLKVHEFPTLKAAMDAISGIIALYPHAGVLFSPGCASFDEFKNYEERGAFFQSSMRQLLQTL